MTFKDGTNTLGTIALSAGSAQFATSTLTAGQHSITAVYSGDTTFAASTSIPLTQVVNSSGLIVTATVVSTPSTSVTQGQPVSFTATVTAPGGQIPAGTVAFFDGATSLGTAALNNGVAVLTTTSLRTGHHNITAVYSGSGTFAASTSPPLAQPYVNPSPDNRIAAHSIVVTSSAALVNLGSPVTFTATITPAPGIVPVPTGTVHFLDGASILGSVPVVNGKAVFTVTLPTRGHHSISAVYGGDAAFLGGMSPVFLQGVQ